MYHIRRADDHDERSLHMENELGFRRAVSEAYLRTHHTGVVHEIVDDNGKQVYVTDMSLLVEVPAAPAMDKMAEPAKKPVAIPWLTLFSLAWLAAVVIHIALTNR